MRFEILTLWFDFLYHPAYVLRYLCDKHNIASDIEAINIQQSNEAYERLLKGDVKYRFVIDFDWVCDLKQQGTSFGIRCT